MKADLPNLLSAASILLGIMTALFGFFYQSINEILEIIPKKHSADNRLNYKLAKATAKTKLIPLLIGSILITIIFLPEMIAQIKNSVIVIFNNGFKDVLYDTLSATYIAVCIFMIFLTIVIIKIGFQMKKQIKKLK